MSIATSFNLAIALLENRPESARNILRALPLEESRSMPKLQHRLADAVDRIVRDRCEDVLGNILMDALKIDLPHGDAGRVQAFMEGVKAVEDLIEKKLFQVTGVYREEENETT